MSNAIRYDSLLVRELARELDDVLRDARVAGAFFDRDRLRFTLQTRAARRGEAEPASLLWQLHPSSGHLAAAPAGAGTGRAQLPAGARISRVHAPPDERVIIIELAGDEAPGSARRIVVELLTNQWNAIATGADERIVALLRERSGQSRELRAGAVYEPPRPSGRPGAVQPLELQEWIRAMADVPAGERLRALPRLAAWTSPQNAAWIIGDADVSPAPAALERAWRRYRELVDAPRLQPVLLHEDDAWLPYVRAPGASVGSPADSLLHAFEQAAAQAEALPLEAESVEEALAAVAERMEAVQKRRRRLEEEQRGATGEGARLRQQADLLLSQLHRARRGDERVELDDFSGGAVVVELDPKLGPSDNATRLYEQARKRERAAARIPALLEAADRDLDRLEVQAARLRDGAATAEEIERLRAAAAAPPRDAPAPLPYRSYRTTGGLEVRVGRGSRSNDELTFRHSSPNDIWLHARDVAGAHVILRWPRADANPPARDVAEAAVLAALHSKARTSGTVPVDWTRRKHVRKPRKAGPGLVLPERVKTVFVEPDPRLEERLREDTLP